MSDDKSQGAEHRNRKGAPRGESLRFPEQIGLFSLLLQFLR
jgi:hypothetical protein